jgi:hypothetical protein
VISLGEISAQHFLSGGLVGTGIGLAGDEYGGTIRFLPSRSNSGSGIENSAKPQSMQTRIFGNTKTGDWSRFFWLGKPELPSLAERYLMELTGEL